MAHDDQALTRRIRQLVDVVEGPFEDDRLYAIQQLGVIRTTEKPPISALIKASEANSSAIKKAAMEALGKIGHAAAEAALVLATALKDPDETVREKAVFALMMIGPFAVPALTAALKDPDETVRGNVADAQFDLPFKRFDTGMLKGKQALRNATSYLYRGRMMLPFREGKDTP